MLKLIFIFVLLFYITYRFCKVSSMSDDKDLEDELFMKMNKKDE